MNHLKKSLGILIALILLLGYSSTVVITEGHRGLVLRWGDIVTDNGSDHPRIEFPGLHYQFPWIYEIRPFDIRLRTWTADSDRILTADKQAITAHYFIKWRIVDVARYFVAANGQEKRTQSLVVQSVNNTLRTQVGLLTLPNLLTNDREKLLLTLREHAQKNATALGVSIIDVQLTRIEPLAIEATMRAAQVQLAQQRRAEGKADAASLHALADSNGALVIAKAKEKSAEIRGQGDAQAAKLYADAYSKSPEFYSFYRSMEAYKKVFANDQTVLVLRPEGQFFKYFNIPQNKEKK